MDWQLEARCLNMGWEVFFAHKPHVAKRICMECPVSSECLSFAMSNEQGERRRFGVFGGLSADERLMLSGQLTVDRLEQKRAMQREKARNRKRRQRAREGAISGTT